MSRLVRRETWRRNAFSILPTAFRFSMDYADPLYRSAVFHLSQRALASAGFVYTVIICVKHEMRLHTTASSAGLPRLHIPLLLQEGARGWSSWLWCRASKRSAGSSRGGSGCTAPTGKSSSPRCGLARRNDVGQLDTPPLRLLLPVGKIILTPIDIPPACGGSLQQ